MKKKSTDQTGAHGICATAFGYAMKAKPGPDSATVEIGTPCSCAMNPRTEKTTKPAKRLVPLLQTAMYVQSLRKL